MNLKKAFIVRSRLTRHYRELERDVERLNYEVINWMAEAEDIKRNMIKLQEELDEINSELVADDIPQDVLDYIAKM